MTIFAKLDVTIWSHEKVLDAGPAAFGMWAACLAYLRQHETADGHLKTQVIGQFFGLGKTEATKLCDKLVAVGLFAVHPDGGYVFLRYAEHNETKADIDTRRKETRKRVETHRTKTKTVDGNAAGNSRVTRYISRTEDPGNESVPDSPSGSGSDQEETAPPAPASGPLPDGVVAVERTFWVESYKSGIAAGGGPGAYVFPDRKFGALRSVVEAHCLGEDRRNIPSWVQARVALFARRRRALGWPPNTEDPWHPDALLAWHNSQDYQDQARARSGPRIKAAKPVEDPAPELSREETQAAAERLRQMMRGIGG